MRVLSNRAQWPCCARAGVRIARFTSLVSLARRRHTKQTFPGNQHRLQLTLLEQPHHALGDTEGDHLYRGRELSEQWVRCYNEKRLHSALNYLRPGCLFLQAHSPSASLSPFQCSIHPPSTTTVCPVMRSLSSEAKNATIPTKSSGCCGRLINCSFRARSRASSSEV